MNLLSCGHLSLAGDGPCRMCATLARRAARKARPAGKATRPIPTAVPECVHRGGVIGTEICEVCKKQEDAPPRLIEVLSCALKGSCTVDPAGVVRQVQRCQTCSYEPKVPAPVPAPPPAEVRWVSTAQLTRDAVTLAGLLPSDCSGVVGVPRSGMLPAAILAAHLHLPLYEWTPAGPRLLGYGLRGVAGFGGPLAVVDDTVYSGNAMRRARASMKRVAVPAVFCAVYARPEAAGACDLYAHLLPCPHLLEWNLFNGGALGGFARNKEFFKAGVATDLDGVLVHDERSGGTPGTAYLLPRRLAVPLIATGRPEWARAETEAMLRRLGARWTRLEMLPDGVEHSAASAAAHKARAFAAGGFGLFVESCPVQAEEIHRLTGLPVVCPRDEGGIESR